MSACSPPEVPRDASPKYLQLARSFEHQLRAGVLRVGDRLPSIRQLREAHRISAATAVACYLWLERQGYVRARPKSGYFVARTPAPEGPAPGITRRVRGPVSVRVSGLAPAGVEPARGPVIDMGPAAVSPALLPVRRLNRSVRLALSAFSDHAVCYEDPSGSDRLRRQIARLMFLQGVTCTADDVIVTSGSTEALHLALRAITRPGDIVAIESPSCYESLQVLESLHLRALEIPHIRHEGMDFAKLEAAASRHRLAAILTTATCHNPFGDCADDGAKARLVAFATRHAIPIVEGDCFGDLVFVPPRPRSMKAFDTEGIVLHYSSLANHLAPGFNLGWVHPGRWRAQVRHLKSLTNVASARLPQLALAEFLESGALEAHLRDLRAALWRAVEAARNEVLRTFPAGTRVSQPEGGWVLWVQLPESFDGAEVVARAAAEGIIILPGIAFSANGQYRNCIRLACGHPVDVLVPAIRRLATLLV